MQTERFPHIRPILDYSHDPARIELEKGCQHHQCKQLMLRVVSAAVPAGVGRKGTLGNLEIDGHVTRTVTISEQGETRVELPEEAKKAIK